ncbi:hypothetical protein ACWEJ6_52055 [Nonomuraea sp. NPDC004702]
MNEIDRPDRETRRFQGKSDPIDPVDAAKPALSGDRTGTSKQHDGQLEAPCYPRVARRSTINQRADTQRQLKALIVTAPDDPRSGLRGVPTGKLITTCAVPAPRSHPRPRRRPGHRHNDRTGLPGPPPAAHHGDQRPGRAAGTPVAAINPAPLAAYGLGVDTSGQLLVTAGDNHDRLSPEAAFAMLAASSDPRLLRRDHPASSQPRQ